MARRGAVVAQGDAIDVVEISENFDERLTQPASFVDPERGSANRASGTSQTHRQAGACGPTTKAQFIGPLLWNFDSAPREPRGETYFVPTLCTSHQGAESHLASRSTTIKPRFQCDGGRAGALCASCCPVWVFPGRLPVPHLCQPPRACVLADTAYMTHKIALLLTDMARWIWPGTPNTSTAKVTLPPSGDPNEIEKEFWVVVYASRSSG
jgi:hypothetical protein